MTIQVDKLFINAFVLTMDEQLTQYKSGALAVNGDTIVSVGPEADLQKTYTANETINCNGKVLMPGLINTHTHVPMSLLRGLADDLRLDVWLLGYMMPVEREFVCPDFVRLGTQIACSELIRSGVTCFADMYYYEHYVAQETAEIGMRALCGQTVLKYTAPDAEFFEESLATSSDFISEWKNHPLIVPSVAPHALYTSTDEILRASIELALEHNVPLQTHFSETASEVNNSRKEYGMPVIPLAEKYHMFDADILAAHCVHIDENEILTLAQKNVGIAHNPSSNLKLASGIAPVTQMLDAGINVGIGTDGPASNNDLDMFEEMRLAAFVAKYSTGDPTSLPAQEVLSMATRIGAKAMYMDHLVGTLEPGKKADLIIVEHTDLHHSPHFARDNNSIYSQLVYAGKSNDVCDVMVNGKWLMRNRQLLTIEEDDLISQAEEYASRIDTFLVEREQSVLSKLIAIGGAMEEESFEVQVKVRIPDADMVIKSIEDPEIEVLYRRRYHEYDTYFQFDDPLQGTLRYREDEFIDNEGNVSNIRYRLTMIGPVRERKFPSDVMLSRSRYLAQASHSLRFYREYFKPTGEIFIEKDRRRWRVLFQGTEFYINLDTLVQPDLGIFLEVKSRTWSRRDAEHKSEIIASLIEHIGASSKEGVTKDYIEMTDF